MAFVLMVVGFLVLVTLLLLLAWRGHQADKKRIAALTGYAAGQGWAYAEDDPSLCTRWDGRPFGFGQARRAGHVMTGTYRQRSVIAFDYQYEESTTDSNGNRETTTSRYSIYAVGLPCPLPKVSMTPEGMFSKLGHAVGIHDIQLESEQFNKAFRVSSEDKKLAYDMLPARSMELLLTQPKVHLRTDGTWLLCVDSGVLQPTKIAQRLDLMGGLVDNVPAFVWEDRTRPDPAAGTAGA